METPALVLDPTDPEFRNNRYPTYGRLRDEAPVLSLELNGVEGHLVTRYADVDGVMRDERARVRPASGELPAHVGNGPAADFYRYTLPCIDPPDHTRLRKLMAPALAPRVVSNMASWITEIIDRRIDELAGAEEIDFVKDFAMVVPAQIACRFMHVPDADAEEVVRNQPALTPVLSLGEITPEQLAAADQASQFYFDYLGGLIDDLRGSLPEDDVVGAMLAAQDDGDRMSRMELIVSVIDLFIASYHTTMVSLTAAVHTFLTHPDQLALLRSEPSLAANAWEETLRYDAPVHMTWRELIEPMEVAGEEIDGHVILALAAANRDERQFPLPDAFDIRRKAKRHMAFAAGGHYCLGAPLSRLEGEIFLQHFFDRFPDVELAGGDPSYFPDFSFPFIEELPLRLGSTA
jgi:cytochrome P450